MKRATRAGGRLSCLVEIGSLLIAVAMNAGGCGGRTTTARDAAVASGGQSGNIATGGTTIPVGTGGSGTGGAAALVGTGGHATGGATGMAAGGAASDAGPTSNDGSPDVPPLDPSCSGEPKLGRPGVTVTAPITAYRMSPAACCSARYGILFHSQGAWGSDVEVVVLQTETRLTSGDYRVDDSWDPVRVVSHEWRVSSGADQLAGGTLRITGDTGVKDIFQLGLSVHPLSSDKTIASTFFCVPGIDVAPDTWASRLQFFLLDDPTLPVTDVAKLPLDALVLAKDPLLDMSRIASVTQSNGEVRYLGSGDFGQSIRDRMKSQSLLVMAFVVVADGARIYLGTFVSPLSSLIGPGPFVDTDGMSADRFRIAPVPRDTDARWDARILKVLRESSRLVE